MLIVNFRQCSLITVRYIRIAGSDTDTGKNVLMIAAIAVILVGAGTYTEAYCNPLILKKLYGYLY